MGPPEAPVKKGTGCEVCDEPQLLCRWTDTHGIGACSNCGAPYKLYHYDENKQFLDEPPELLLKEKWVPTIRRYWQEVGHNVAPGRFNFSGSSYEVATQADADSIDSWMKAHRDELPTESNE